jgi:hypothetical protein
MVAAELELMDERNFSTGPSVDVMLRLVTSPNYSIQQRQPLLHHQYLLGVGLPDYSGSLVQCLFTARKNFEQCSKVMITQARGWNVVFSVF